MKKALSILAALAFAGSAYAQGTITLSNADLPAPGGGTYNAVINLDPVTLGGGFPGAAYSVGLFLADSTTPLPGSVSSFFNGTGAQAEFNWIINPNPEVSVTGSAAGSSPSLFVGAWRTADGTFANAVATGASGRSAAFTAQPLGGPNPAGGPPFPTPPTTFQGFTITLVPEPTTMALGMLGLGALALRRRK
jgi:hypothetical protein